MRSRISRSRAVSSGNTGAGSPRETEKKCTTRAAIAGLKIASPSATALIARAICSWPAPLRT
jgi:hypothetical protein